MRKLLCSALWGALESKEETQKSSFKDLPPQEMDGFVISIKNIQEKKTYRCGEDCTTLRWIKEGTWKDCDRCVNPKVRGSFSGIEITIHIVATTSANDVWTCIDDDVQIISSKGYSYKGMILCDDVADTRHRAKEHDEIPQKTMADIVYTFPFLPEGEQIQAIIVGTGRDSLRFDVVEGEEDIYDIRTYRHLFQNDNDTSETKEDGSDDIEQTSYYQRAASNSLHYLKTMIFQRLNTHISPSEAQRLEDKIEMQIYSVNLRFEEAIKQGNEVIDSFYTDFQDSVANYREVLYQKKFVEQQHEVRVERVSELLNINPYDFEYLCSTIMERMGYTNIKVTPRSNDKGIDIIGEMNGEMTVAQCKRHKSSVGSPEMQMFIGAMHNAKATKGIYFSTGSFTYEAEKMARTNDIILFGKEQFIARLALVEDFRTDTITQTKLWDDGDFPDYAKRSSHAES